MPGEQPFTGETGHAVPGGIERHLDDALDAPILGTKRGIGNAESPGKGRAYAVAVEDFAFDLSVLDRFLGAGLQLGLKLEREAQPLHPAQQPSLIQVRRGQRLSEPIGVPSEAGPVGQLPDVHIRLTG